MGIRPTFPCSSIGPTVSLHTVLVAAIFLIATAGFIALAFLPAPPSDTEKHERQSRRDRGDPLTA